MPTNKPRFTITMDDSLYDRIENFKFTHRYKNQTQAVLALIEKGLEILEQNESKPLENPKISSLESKNRKKIIKTMDELNEEGQKQLIETADTMVQSGKYKKASATPRPLAARDYSGNPIEVDELPTLKNGAKKSERKLW